MSLEKETEEISWKQDSLADALEKALANALEKVANFPWKRMLFPLEKGV